MEKTKAQKHADQISDIINGAGSMKAIGIALAHDHRFLQQEFWTLVEGFIEEAARMHDLKEFDDRNAYTVKMCKRINERIEPFRIKISEGTVW
jgi:hypothetical protein